MNRAGNWFEVKVLVEKETEDGFKNVKESYVVEASTFSIAEAMITDNVNCESVTDEKIANFKEIFCLGDGYESFYKVKAQFVTLDERANKEKRQNIVTLVCASDIECARKNYINAMTDTLSEYVIVSISETPIVDIFTV